MFHHDFRIRITSVGFIGVLLVTSALAHPTAGVAARGAERFALDAHEGPTPVEFLLAPATVVPAVVSYANLFTPHVRAVAGVDATRDATTRTGDQAVARPDLPTAICTVTSAADSGAGTLRQCLLGASANDTITFDPAMFPPAAPVAIALASPLPFITLNGLTIDASNAGVILNGSGLLMAGSGLVVSGANGITIRGLRIQNFPTHGIQITDGARNTIIGGETSAARNVIGGNGRAGVALIGAGVNDNRVQGNYIGVNAAGSAAHPNLWGVAVSSGAQNNIIGGLAAGAGNLISGNSQAGVQFELPGTTGNQVLGNRIGVNAGGTAALANVFWGVIVLAGAQNNRIGGETNGAGNVISGNRFGVQLQDPATTGNVVLGNYIGVNATGAGSVGNIYGVVIGFGARDNIVGGETSGARNVISGNTMIGVDIGDPGTNGNRVLGNFIGTDASGTARLGNEAGVVIFGGQSNIIGGTTTQARNVISGNRQAGVQLEDTTTSGNQILGNYIGTTVSGTAPLSNTIGVGILGAKANTIGGAAAGAGNLISGNEQAGVAIQALGADGNLVQGNVIGLDATGAAPLSNKFGVVIDAGPKSNLIGGESSATRNVISGNTPKQAGEENAAGVVIQGIGTTGNQVLGNFIGLNVTGALAVANRSGVAVVQGAQNNRIGGVTSGARNIISGNATGVVLSGNGTSNNQVLGNFIGTDPAGVLPVANVVGVLIASQAATNTIGGASEAERNLISGNTEAGVYIGDAKDDTTTNKIAGNRVVGNYIGVKVDGAARLSNAHGVVVGKNASANLIGDVNPGAGNLISGNDQAGVSIQDARASGNKVLGNRIGVNAAGDAAVSNLRGMVIGFGANGNVIGGVEQGAPNFIAGNVEAGVQFQGSGTSNNKVLSNTIGTDTTGALALGNGYGVVILGQASSNAVEERNLIKHNVQHGVVIADEQTTGNQMRGNEIVSNTLHGVMLQDGASSNMIGISNTIAYNGSYGVAISGTTTLNNTITRNSIHHNAPPQIKFVGAPVPISDAGTCYADLVKSVSCPNCRVEFFAYPGAEIGSTAFMQGTAAAAGRLPSLSTLRPDGMCYVFATVTLADGTTSEFYPVLCPAAYASSLYKDYALPKPTPSPTPVART